MDNLISDVNNLALFLIEFLLIYIPCATGSVLGKLFRSLKHKNALKRSPSKKKKLLKHNIGVALTSATAPSLVILLTDYFLPNGKQLDFITKYSIAMLLGFSGADKVTAYLMNLTNLVTIMQAISKGASGLSELPDMLKIPDDEEDDDEEDN
jgi:hypothetical protein